MILFFLLFLQQPTAQDMPQEMIWMDRAGKVLGRVGSVQNAIFFPEISPEHQRRLLERYHDPDPRVGLGALLAAGGLASAAIDVSDGLGIDAGRVARASGVRLVLEADRVPISAPLRAFAAMADQDALELALSGGDDYELLFTVPEERVDALERAVSGSEPAVTRIGVVQPGFSVRGQVRVTVPGTTPLRSG